MFEFGDCMSCWYYRDRCCMNPESLNFESEMSELDGCLEWLDVPEEELEGK